MTKVLLTGGSGFIAAHILEQLLDQGHSVVTTVRSEEKAAKIRDAHRDKADRLELAIVPDIAQANAFDEVVKTKGLEAVIHAASPFHYNWTNALTELIAPALNGTKGLLSALKTSAPGVKRVVITSSFASILDEAQFANPNHTFTEKSWNPSGLADVDKSAPTAYRVSKTLAERAAWSFIEEEKPNFDLVTVAPPLVLGPVVHSLATLESINTSNERVVALLQGKWKDEIPFGGPVTQWIDVRDTARAHVLALEKSEAGGKRLFTTPGSTSNREIADIVRANFPEFKDRLPGPDVKGGEAPAADKSFKINNDETNKVLGIKYITIEKSIKDLVESLKAHGI